MKCIFSPNEAVQVAQGNVEFFVSLQQQACPELAHAEPVFIQQQFQEIISSQPKAVAYLWRGTSVEAIQANANGALEPCQESPGVALRCESIQASHRGELSRFVAESEESSLGTSTCDWRGEEIGQDRAWLKYFEKNKGVLENKSEALQLIKSFPGFRKAFPANAKLTQGDINLLGRLALMGRFFSQELKIKFKDDAGMMDALCSKTYDCNMISTRAFDLLQKSGVKNFERMEAVSLPGHVTLRVTLESGSFVYFNNGTEFLGAKTFDRHVLKVTPAWQMVATDLSDLGVVLEKQGALQDSLEVLLKAIEMDPQFLGSYLNLANTLEKMEDLEGAISVSKQAMQLNPKNIGAHLILGGLLQKKKDFEGAIGEYRKVIEINPQWPGVYLNLGLALEEKGDLEGAIVAYRKAIKLNPQFSGAHNNLGNVYGKLGRGLAAIVEYRRAIQIDPHEVAYHLSLASAYETNKNFKKARVEYQKSLKIDPYNLYAKESLQRLK